MKISLLVGVLLNALLLQAQEAYEKEFITLVNEKVKDGNISAIKSVDCKKGDCYIEGLEVISSDMETGESSKTTVGRFNVKNAQTFIAFKAGNGVLKAGEKRQFELEFNDIKSDDHNLFFDEKKLAESLGKKSPVYQYFEKYLNQKTDGNYAMSMQKVKESVLIEDSGNLTTGDFAFRSKNRYTIKGGFAKLDELSETNPMGTLSYIVINSVNFTIDNPKGFLKNLLYMNYQEAMNEATSKQERIAINETFLLSGEKLHSNDEFANTLRKSSSVKIKKMAKEDPSFNELVNKDGQFEKKLDAVLAGTSSHISVTIDNPNSLSLGDFFTLFMGYAMQQKLVVKPDITVSIK